MHCSSTTMWPRSLSFSPTAFVLTSRGRHTRCSRDGSSDVCSSDLELGKVYISLRRREEAEKELRAALDQDGEDTSAIYFLGALYVQNGEYRKSVPLLEQAHKEIGRASCRERV